VALVTALPFAETWADAYVRSTDLAYKLSPPPLPRPFRDAASPLRIDRPGRPAILRPAPRRERTPKAEALKEPYFRAKVLHSFFHHELQAAELMCWAVLAFPEAEPEFKRGLLGICLDEIRHMNLYREHIEHLGSSLGAFGVRDWFWRRVPACETAIAFVSVMGMGLEAANLEHAPTFAARFRAAGDETGAAIQEQIAREELAHVSFAVRWFERWTGGCRFEDWVSHLPPPLTPWVLRGEPMATGARIRAGMPAAFVEQVAAYRPGPTGPGTPSERP
jgi:uncharacterized ferritin-like protein (DUF455 family)